MGSSTRSVAEAFGEILRREGVRHTFGFPGGATVEMAEHASREGVEFVLAHSEWAAGYMAAMHGDLTGKPGVLLTTLGPGATNAANATANAFLDRSPMLAITGRTALGAGSHSHQRLDQRGLYAPITKWSTEVAAPSFRRQMHRALRLAVAERPGPVHLDLPSDQVAVPCEDAGPGCATGARLRYGPPEGLEEAGRTLRAARRPLVVAGYTALRRGACGPLQRLAERWGMPVVTTPKAKGVLPESHPYWAGVIEMAGAHGMDEFVGGADLLLAVGFDPVELIMPWKHRTPVIHVDALPNTDDVYVSELDLLGDIPATLEGLSDLSGGSAPRWTEREVAAWRQEYLRRNVAAGDGLAPSQVVFTAREMLDPTTVVISDVGSHKMLLGGLWKTELPRTFFMSNGLGTMGFALPASLAAQVLLPDRRVVCFTGDGGLAMVAGELGTAVDRGLPVVVVVFNDGALDRIVRKQEAQRYALVGTKFGNPDFVKLAEAYGLAGFRACTPGEFRRSLEAALLVDGPALIEARIDPDEYRVQFHA